MKYVHYLIGVDVNDLCAFEHRFGWIEIAPVKVGMAMEMVTRPGNTQQPVNGFETLMRLRIFVMNAKGRRMSDEDIKGASVTEAVEQEARQHFERPKVSLRLSVLIRSVGSVLNASAQAADQEGFVAYQFLVHV